MKKQKINFDKKMQEITAGFSSLEKVPAVLLHSCCAPCSSSVILRLAPFLRITVFYYNPNIDTAEEYAKRAAEQKHIISIYNKEEKLLSPISVIEEKYMPEEFFKIAKGFEPCTEGGERCMRCYRLRIQKTAETAIKGGFDFFTTTLSVSPLKNAEKINAIGSYFSTEQCKWLPSDFKKRNGYLNSVMLSKKFGLYRQDYCGCVYSKR